MKRFPIIDAHCHAGLGDGLTGPWDTDASLHRYGPRARAAGIDATVLFSVLTSDCRAGNGAVGDLVRAHPRRYLGFAYVNPATAGGRVAEVVDDALRWGACGIKVHWHDGRVTREIADVARQRGLPVLYDPHGDTGSVETAARAYPDVAWIIPHLSTFADDWRAQTAFVDQLTRLPNVFTDTSGVRYFDVLADAVRLAGAHKVLFGSDGPFLHPGVELAKVRALRLPPDRAALVLGGNLLRLTGRRAVRTRRSASAPRPAGGAAPGR
ncbi:amidohydrolase family protein [Umezawaea endophytica]|uniref:Amidohydrolase family protein n=1 Tax=Umezawaea endophytica TaxID=1654476 RepID=A0A9X2VKK3_9PSEU|nr:amidohydrolase family protein [Umezawaea endophytica]MCS7477772.1 amidohydrolase family protein [Umezawaea endophytica]